MNAKDWISTKDMLPAFNRKVLVADVALDDNPAYYVAMFICDGTWISSDGKHWNGMPAWWMPIVTPPPF